MDAKAWYDCKLKTTPLELFHPFQKGCRRKLTSEFDRAGKITIDLERIECPKMDASALMGFKIIDLLWTSSSQMYCPFSALIWLIDSGDVSLKFFFNILIIGRIQTLGSFIPYNINRDETKTIMYSEAARTRGKRKNIGICSDKLCNELCLATQIFLPSRPAKEKRLWMGQLAQIGKT